MKVTTCIGKDRASIADLFVPPDLIDEFRDALGIPCVQWAVFTSDYTGWHYIKFSRPFNRKPAVAAIMDAFDFEFPDMRSIYAEALRDAFIDFAGDWGVLNWLRNKFSTIFYYVGWAIGSLQNIGLSAIQQKLLRLTQGMGVTPAAVRNVTQYGCEIYAPAGVQVFFIAVERWL